MVNIIWMNSGKKGGDGEPTLCALERVANREPPNPPTGEGRAFTGCPPPKEKLKRKTKRKEKKRKKTKNRSRADATEVRVGGKWEDQVPLWKEGPRGW